MYNRRLTFTFEPREQRLAGGNAAFRRAEGFHPAMAAGQFRIQFPLVIVVGKRRVNLREGQSRVLQVNFLRPMTIREMVLHHFDHLDVCVINPRHAAPIDPDVSRWFGRNHVGTIAGGVKGDNVNIMNERPARAFPCSSGDCARPVRVGNPVAPDPWRRWRAP
jgi:hypothetical protein